MPAATRARAMTNPRSHLAGPGGDHQAGVEIRPKVGEETGIERAREIHIAGVMRATGQRGERLQQRQPARRPTSGGGKQGDPARRKPTRGEHPVEDRHRGGPRACLLRRSATAKRLGTVPGSKCRQSGGQGIGHRSSLERPPPTGTESRSAEAGRQCSEQMFESQAARRSVGAGRDNGIECLRSSQATSPASGTPRPMRARWSWTRRRVIPSRGSRPPASTRERWLTTHGMSAALRCGA